MARVIFVLLLSTVANASAQDPFAAVENASGQYRARVVNDLQALYNSRVGFDPIAQNDLMRLPEPLRRRLLPLFIGIVRAPAALKPGPDKDDASTAAHVAAVAAVLMGPEATAQLIALLANADEFVVGPASEGLQAIPILPRSDFAQIQHLVTSKNPTIRSNGMILLMRTDPQRSFPILIDELEDKDLVSSAYARQFLSNYTTPELIGSNLTLAMFGDLSRSLQTRNYKAEKIALMLGTEASKLSSFASLLSTKDLIAYRDMLASDAAGIGSHPNRNTLVALFSINHALGILNKIIRQRRVETFFKASAPYAIVPLAWAFIVLLVVALWRFAPGRLRDLNIAARGVDMKFPDWLGSFTLSLRSVFLIKALAETDRVLDSWTSSVLEIATRRFKQKEGPSAHQYYVDVPGLVDGKPEPNLASVANLLVKKCCILIAGEGGLGKTALAFRICRFAMDESQPLGHPVLPALLDYNFSETGDEKDFTSACRGQVQALLEERGAIDPEFVKLLLARGRIVVVIDGISEMSEATRKSIRPDGAGFEPSLLIVTSRFSEPLSQIPKTTVAPLRIEGNRLSTFVDAYLVHIQKKHLFEDPEYFEALRKLSLIVGTAKVTALFAKLFADVMVFSIEQGDRTLPSSIPGLIRRYVYEIKLRVPSTYRIADVMSALQALSILLLEEDLVPRPFNRKQAIDVIDAPEADDLLDELETRLGLIEKTGFAKEQLRFTLDPIAEYFYAAGFAAKFDANERRSIAAIRALQSRCQTGAMQTFAKILREVLMDSGFKYPMVFEELALYDR